VGTAPAHVIAVADSAPPHSPASTDTADAYYAAAQYLSREGRDAHTIRLRAAGLTQYERVLGDTHPQTLSSRNNLAYAYQAAGDLDRAIPLYEATLAQYEQVLGDTHPNTLQSRNNLASAYKQAGDLGRAIPLLETTLAQREQVLGDTHPQTLTSRNNLAGARRAAEAVQQGSTATSAATLAPTQPSTAD
jgi:tetratricopeptide (TPR) repeat protein